MHDDGDTGSLAHGGRLAEARRLFPHAPEPLLDLSTGINPLAYPLGDIPAARWTRLPEPDDVLALQRAAASAYGVEDPDMVVAAPGTQALINLLPLLLPQREVAVLAPTYSEHAHRWHTAGSLVAEVATVADLQRAACGVVCNPNNPDGSRVEPARLLADRPKLLIVDEAFADFEHGISLAPLLPLPGVIVLRSFGKAYGLAGLRLGFALAEPALVRRIRDALGPWAVSGPAIEIGVRALGDRAWTSAAASRLAEDAHRLDGLLAPHLRVVGGTTLFRLAEGRRAPDLFAHLGRAGIHVRRFADQPHRLRFGLPGTAAEWERLRAALDLAGARPGT